MNSYRQLYLKANAFYVSLYDKKLYKIRVKQLKNKNKHLFTTVNSSYKDKDTNCHQRLLVDTEPQGYVSHML